MPVTHDDPTVKTAGDTVANALSDLESLFKPGVKLTFLARRPDVSDGSQDMVITNDSLDGVIAAIEIRRAAVSGEG